jgi:hypothetical protein
MAGEGVILQSLGRHRRCTGGHFVPPVFPRRQIGSRFFDIVLVSQGEESKSWECRKDDDEM